MMFMIASLWVLFLTMMMFFITLVLVLFLVPMLLVITLVLILFLIMMLFVIVLLWVLFLIAILFMITLLQVLFLIMMLFMITLFQVSFFWLFLEFKSMEDLLVHLEEVIYPLSLNWKLIIMVLHDAQSKNGHIVLVAHFVNEFQKPSYVIVDFVKTLNFFGSAMALQVNEVLAKHGLNVWVIAQVKDKGANLSTITQTLTSCDGLGLHDHLWSHIEGMLCLNVVNISLMILKFEVISQFHYYVKCEWIVAHLILVRPKILIVKSYYNTCKNK